MESQIFKRKLEEILIKKPFRLTSIQATKTSFASQQNSDFSIQKLTEREEKSLVHQHVDDWTHPRLEQK